MTTRGREQKTCPMRFHSFTLLLLLPLQMIGTRPEISGISFVRSFVHVSAQPAPDWGQVDVISASWMVVTRGQLYSLLLITIRKDSFVSNACYVTVDFLSLSSCVNNEPIVSRYWHFLRSVAFHEIPRSIHAAEKERKRKIPQGREFRSSCVQLLLLRMYSKKIVITALPLRIAPPAMFSLGWFDCYYLYI